VKTLPDEIAEDIRTGLDIADSEDAIKDVFGLKFDPTQPRVPAGDPDGGQWTSEDSQFVQWVIDNFSQSTADRLSGDNNLRRLLHDQYMSRRKKEPLINPSEGEEIVVEKKYENISKDAQNYI
jgi:hypothetical protein